MPLNWKNKAEIKAMHTGVMDAIRKALQKGMQIVRETVKDPYLTGKALNVDTGTLRRSITYKTEKVGTSMVKASVGTNVIYGRIHELGFSGPVSVERHARYQYLVYGKKMKTPRMVAVEQHTRNMKMPARPFLRPALEEHIDDIEELIRDAVIASVVE